MVIYDFVCAGGHRFEGWFDSAAECQAQCASGLVSCPVCGSLEVEKQLCAPAVHLEKSSTLAPAPDDDGAPARAIKLRRQVEAVATYIQEHCEDVGTAFAQEALAMHRGERAQRSIVGQSTHAEESALVEAGVDFYKLRLPRFDD